MTILSAHVFDTKYRLITKPGHVFLELHEKHVVCRAVYNSEDSDDEDALVWQPKRFNMRMVFLKKDMCNVIMYYDNTHSCWQVNVEFAGTNEEATLSYQSGSDAKVTYDIIQEYFLTGL